MKSICLFFFFKMQIWIRMWIWWAQPRCGNEVLHGRFVMNWRSVLHLLHLHWSAFMFWGGWRKDPLNRRLPSTHILSPYSKSKGKASTELSKVVSLPILWTGFKFNENIPDWTKGRSWKKRIRHSCSPFIILIQRNVNVEARICFGYSGHLFLHIFSLPLGLR